MTIHKRPLVTDTKFAIGQIIHHRLFDYRGVIIDVDPEYSGPEEWYEMVAKSKPPKDEPWYHVLVDDGEHNTYVSEQNLESDAFKSMVDHPMTDAVFEGFEDGMYKKPLDS